MGSSELNGQVYVVAIVHKSAKMLTHSWTKEVAAFMSKLLNYSHNQIALKHWSFTKKMSESLNYSFNWFNKNYSSFIHSSKCGVFFYFSQSQWNDMIWLQSLSHWVSAGFAYNHWPEGRKSVGLRQHPISWLNISNLMWFCICWWKTLNRNRTIRPSALGEAYWPLPLPWKSALVTTSDFKLARCGLRVAGVINSSWSWVSTCWEIS